MSTKERLYSFLKFKKLSAKAFEENVGLGNGFVSKVGFSIREEKLDLISKFYPELNLTWLLTGEGEMIKKANQNTSSDSQIDSLENYRLVPLINMDAVGGINSNNEIVLTESEYLIGRIAFNDALDGDLCMPVSGNSMTPTCPPGSIVLVREVLDWNEYFGFGNIFVLLLKDGRRIIKEITRYDDNPKEYILCVSHNASVPSEELPKKLINRVWKVIKILVNEGW